MTAVLVPPCGHTERRGGCRTCFWMDDRTPTGEAYRQMWAEAVQVPDPPCVHLGAPTGGAVECPSCNGKVRLKLRGCDLHGICVTHKTVPGVACCASCEDRTTEDPWTAAPVRDLALFVYPRAAYGGIVWRRELARLLTQMDLFQGRRAVAVAVGPGTESPQEVWRAGGGEFDHADMIVVRNDPEKWECTGLPSLLARMRTDDPNRALLFAHAKGVTHEPDFISREWTAALWDVMLDWPAVEAALVKSRVAGAFRWKAGIWPEHSRATWFYSGSFWWVRSRHLFRRDWQRMDGFKYAAESYIPIHFAYEESACLAFDECGSVYDRDLWASRFWPEWAAWLKARGSGR